MITLHRPILPTLAVAVLGALSMLASPALVIGQGLGGIPVFLAIPETFPDVEGRVVLLREPGRDIVLLRAEDATPETLSVALTLLGRLEERTPRRQGQVQMVPVTGYARRVPLDPDRWSMLSEALARLEQRPSADLGSVGRGRAIRFHGGDG